MFSVAWLVCAAFFYEIILIHEASTTIVETSYNEILGALNVSELNITTFDTLLQKLRLDNCNGSKELCGDKCLTSGYVYHAKAWSNTTVIESSQLQSLSSALLYFLLPEKNAGQSPGRPPRRKCQDGVLRRDDVQSVFQIFLRYYETNGHICARFLNNILRDVKNTLKHASVTKQCFSAKIVLTNLSLPSHNGDTDSAYFSNITMVILSHLIRGHCISVESEHEPRLPCDSFFLSNLVTQFGNSSRGIIPVHGFEDILKDLGIGMSKSEDFGTHDHANLSSNRKRRDTSVRNGVGIKTLSKKCYTSHELLNIYSIDESDGLYTEQFKEICPSLIQQFVSKSCVATAKQSDDDDEYDTKYVWVYAFVAVFIISLLSLAGIAVIPTMKEAIFKKIVIVLVGLAIGTLVGDALLHLIPHAAGFHSESHDHSSKEGGEDKAFIWRFAVVVSGLYGFFIFETFTHLFLRSGGHGHSHKIEHTRKHSPFERNNSCSRTLERHELRGLAHNSMPDHHDHHHHHHHHHHDTEEPQVIYNKGSDESNAKSDDKLNADQDHEHKHHDHHEQVPNILKESPDGHGKTISSVGWMIIIGDTIHNITDGIAIGAAFSEDLAGGLSTSIAVFCHELPHELGDFAVLISSGMTIRQALFANFCSACSSFIGLVIGLLIGGRTENGSQWVFAVMGGMFLYIALVDMLPELMHSDELGGGERYQIFLLQNLGMLSGFVIMFFIAFYEEDLVISL